MVISQSVLEVSALTAAERSRLGALYEQHYTAGHNFQRDLLEKDWVLLLRDPQGIVGFSTLQRLEMPVGVVYFSGDTLVLPAHRHSYDLPRLWGQFVFQKVAQEGRPCLWFLICSGFRTYRFLPVFFQRFYPRHDQPTPADIQQSLDQLATSRFGSLYQQGVVQLASANHEPLPARRLDAHAQYFLQKNPGWAQGHELACLTWLDPGNLTRAGQRMVNGC